MSAVDDAQRIAKDLLKQGQARVTVKLDVHADDHETKERGRPPACEVQLTIKDPATGKTIRDDYVKDIVTNVGPPYEVTFVIPIQNLAKTVGGLFGIGKPKALLVEIEARPVGGFVSFPV